MPAAERLRCSQLDTKPLTLPRGLWGRALEDLQSCSSQSVMRMSCMHEGQTRIRDS